MNESNAHEKRPRTRLALGLAAGLLLAAAAVLLYMSRNPRGAASPSPSPSPGFAGAGNPLEPGGDGLGSRRENVAAAVRPATRPAAPAIAGRVLDRTFRTPVVAEVRPESGPSVISEPVQGAFELPAGSENAGSIAVRAVGYLPATFDRPESVPSAPLELLLDPAAKSAVVVLLADGRPAAGLPVVWRAAVDEPELDQVSDWIRSDAQISGVSMSARTDAVGRSEVQTGVPLLASVSDASGAIAAVLRLLPGQELRVVLPVQDLRLQFVDQETRAPLAGLEIDTWSPKTACAMSVTLRTDETGCVAVAGGQFPVLVRRHAAALWQSELIPLQAGMSRVGTGGRLHTMVRIDAAPSAGVATIAVKSCGGTIKLLDEQSGLPLDVAVRVMLRDPARCAGDGAGFSVCSGTSPRANSGTPDEVYRSKHGLLRLPCTLGDLGSTTDPGLQAAELVISAAGYAPATLPVRALVQAPAAAPPEVRLHACEERRLRVLQSDGAPYRQAIAVYSPKGDVLVWQSRGRADGMHGPFDWPGGELRVRVGQEREWRFPVGADECRTNPVLTLSVPVATGTIAVEGVPQGFCAAALVARLGVSLNGTTYRPTSCSGSRCQFESLPVGSYLVGPRDWVLGSEMNGLAQVLNKDMTDANPRVDVRAGETTTIVWRDSWSARGPISGRIRFLDAPAPGMMLIPRYGATELMPGVGVSGIPRMVFGRRSVQIPVDVEGRYCIGAEDPLPQLLAVCLLNDGLWGTVQDLQVIETLEPGESLDIALGALELTWGTPGTARSVTVQLALSPESFRHPVDTHLAQRTVLWDTSNSLQIDSVPLAIRRVLVDGRILPVEIRRAQTARVKVNLEELAVAPR